MSEAPKNNPETTNGGGQNNWEAAMADAPEFDADAAQKARNEAYEKSHPDAVKDVEAARAAAKEGDYWETGMAEMKIAARKNMEDHGTFADEDGGLTGTRDHSNSDTPTVRRDFKIGGDLNYSDDAYMTDEDVLNQIDEWRQNADTFEEKAVEKYNQEQKAKQS